MPAQWVLPSIKIKLKLCKITSYDNRSCFAIWKNINAFQGIISLLESTRCAYFLGVLTHTTAWDRLWRGDETLNCVVYTWLGFALPSNAAAVVAVASLKCIWQLCLAKFSVSATFWGDVTGTGTGRGRDGHMDRQTFLGKYYFRFRQHTGKFSNKSYKKSKKSQNYTSLQVF